MKVTVLGTGAFGLALASILAENKNEVVMWTTFEEEKKQILETKTSPKLEGFVLDENIKMTKALIQDFEALTQVKLDNPVYRQKIKDVLGHKWVEVIGGFLVGFITASIMYLLRR